MKVAFHTLGCKVNQYETEALKEAFVLRGETIVGENEPADVYIVNTCTVTNIADRKSRQYIRKMKGINPDAIVVVTGCYAQVEPDEVAGLPEVDFVVGNGRKSEICDLVYKYVDKKLDENKFVLDRSEMTEYEDMGLVISSELGQTRAYIKIQEGCDRFCAYCLIPFARGPVRSRPLDEIIEEAVMLLDAGYKELVLTGINTALYGLDRNFRLNIYDQNGDIYPGCEKFENMNSNEYSPIEVVLAALNSIERDFRIRLSSLEPTVVDASDVSRIIKYDKLCHHLHLSAQSGSSNVLKLMNRRYNQQEYLEIVKAIRDFDPLYGLTTDIIVGFSGETDTDFAESLRVVSESAFGKVHIFRYSPRKGTSGEKLPSPVPPAVKTARASELEKVASETAKKFFIKNLGIKHTVLVEECVKIDRIEYLTGYTGNYIRTYIKKDNNTNLIGTFVSAKLTDLFQDGCIAEV